MINIELEQQLLGTLLAYPDAVHLCDLEAGYFSDDSHRLIYNCILEKAAANELVSVPAVAMEIGMHFAPYIAKLVGLPRVLDVRGACEAIQELSVSANIQIMAGSMVEHLRNGGKSIEALSVLAGLVENGVKSKQMHGVKMVSEAILEDMMNTVKPFSTGIKPLDEAMGGGMYPRKAYGIAARKKVGKTILLGSISHNLNLAGVKHLFICGEMGEKEIQQRTICRVLNAFPSAFRNPTEQLKERVAQYVNNCHNNTIYLDAPGISFDKLKHAVSTAHMKYGIKGFILDYWQLVSGKNGRDTEAFHLGEVAQWIAEIGRKLDIFSLTAAQINQEGNTRGGEGLRLAFDQVYQIHRPDVTDSKVWLEMMDTRYTQWMNIGSGDESGVIDAGLELYDRGPYFDIPNINQNPTYQYGEENA